MYANRSDSDILCLDTLTEIDALKNVHVWYTLDAPPDGWKYSQGFIDETMVRRAAERSDPPSRSQPRPACIGHAGAGAVAGTCMVYSV